MLCWENYSGIFFDHSGVSDCSAVTVAPLSHRIYTSQSKRGLDNDSIHKDRTTYCTIPKESLNTIEINSM